ncbi:hypothetical protein CBNA_1173 [Coxiella burnetii str. Namibia]|nr:hypothetical protein CBNA_1173 [Coxiella burnetii str. Namibia]
MIYSSSKLWKRNLYLLLFSKRKSWQSLLILINQF